MPPRRSLFRKALHPVFRDVALSGATSVGVSVAALLVVSLIGRLADPKGVAEYLLVRRVLSWIVSGVLLGQTLALPRYVAHAVNRPAAQKTFFSVSMVLAMAPTCAVALAICGGSTAFARVLFGDTQFENLIAPLSILLVAYGFHAIVFGYYRGCLQMERANALQFLNFAVFPLVCVAVLWTGRSVAQMFWALSLLMLLTTAALALPIFRYRPQPPMSSRGTWREMLRYGVPRVPGELALGALFTLGPVIAAHYISMASLAPLLLGLGILNIIGTSANPLNQVLLSKVSMMLAEGRMAEARGYIGHLLAAAAELSFFVCIQSVVFADVAIRIWVGPAYSSEGLLIRILLMAIPFYLLHTALRCVIDAGAVTAYNTYNILIAFVVFIALVAVEVRMLPAALLLKSIAATLLLALAVLAWTTARVVKMVYNVRLRWRDSLPSFAFAGFLGCASLAYRYVEHFHTGAFEFMACEVLLNAAFLVFLNRRRCAWFKFVSGGIFRPPAPVPSGIATANTA